jgi:hypothetical protein
LEFQGLSAGMPDEEKKYFLLCFPSFKNQ